jgi:hypothetical protein
MDVQASNTTEFIPNQTKLSRRKRRVENTLVVCPHERELFTSKEFKKYLTT